MAGILSLSSTVFADGDGTAKAKEETPKEETKGEQSKKQEFIRKKLGLPESEATPKVEELLKGLEKLPQTGKFGSGSRWLRIRALGLTKDSRAYEPLVKYLWSGDSSNAEAAAIGLLSLGDKRAIEELKKVLNAREDKKMKEVIKEQRVRYAVASSLLNLDETEVSYTEIEKLLKEGYSMALWGLINENLKTTHKRTIKDNRSKEIMLEAMKNVNDEVRSGASCFALEVGICTREEARKIANNILKTTTNERAKDDAKRILRNLGDRTDEDDFREELKTFEKSTQKNKEK